jgi:pyrroline-5-carboxylate reductase
MQGEQMRFTGTIAVIGGGRMGEAIVAGLIAARTVDASQVTVAEPDARRREAMAEQHGVSVADAAAQAVPADLVLVAVKPQVMEPVLAEVHDVLGEGALVVSIAAGITTAKLESMLPAGTAVVRVMPNTPALVGAGTAVVSGGSETSAEQTAQVAELFSAIGSAVVVEERYQDAASAISGSGPAYFALVIDALARAGVAQGLSREMAERLAVETMRGTAELIMQTGQHPEALVDAVTSPGGTTIAALGALERGGVRSAFNEAVAAAVRRSKELGS